MFSQWCKIVTTNPERHFILKFETLSAGGYRLLMTDFERLWMEEVSTAESLSRILKERAGSFEIEVDDFVAILQAMIQGLPGSFNSFEDGKLVLSHKLGFIKFNWTFVTAESSERLPKMLYHEMILPLFRSLNPSSTSADIEDADVEILNRCRSVKKVDQLETLAKESPPREASSISTSKAVTLETAKTEKPAEPEPVIDPAIVELNKRKELEARLAAASLVAKKKKRLL